MSSKKRAEPIVYLVAGILLFFAGVAALIDDPRHWWFAALMVAGLAEVIIGTWILRSRRGQGTPGSTPSPR